MAHEPRHDIRRTRVYSEDAGPTAARERIRQRETAHGMPTTERGRCVTADEDGCHSAGSTMSFFRTHAMSNYLDLSFLSKQNHSPIRKDLGYFANNIHQNPS